MAGLRVVFFDVDGVLVPVKSSWSYVHKRLGVEKEAEEAARLFLEGRIGYEEWMRRDVELWIQARGGMMHRSDLEAILSEIPVREGARELVSWLHRRGVRVILVSAGVEPLVARVAREVGADAWVSPRLWYDRRGYLLPGGSPHVTPLGPRGKGFIVKRIAGELGVSLDETAFVGDSRWDRDALEVVGHPIAFGGECREIEDIVECRVYSIRGLGRALNDIMSGGSCSSREYE